MCSASTREKRRHTWQTTGAQPRVDRAQPPQLLRLAGVPLFLWLVLGPEADGWALGVLMVSGVTDFLDGWLARKLDQNSVVGQILDPVADRLYILAVVVGLALRDVIPWWLAISLPLRDLLMWGLVPLLRTRGYSALPVHFLGKAATFNLLYAFPLLLLGDGDGHRRHAGGGLRLGVRALGHRPLLVGRRPLRLAGAQAAAAPTERRRTVPRWLRHPPVTGPRRYAAADPDHPAVARRGLPARRRSAPRAAPARPVRAAPAALDRGRGRGRRVRAAGRRRRRADHPQRRASTTPAAPR